MQRLRIYWYEMETNTKKLTTVTRGCIYTTMGFRIDCVCQRTREEHVLVITLHGWIELAGFLGIGD